MKTNSSEKREITIAMAQIICIDGDRSGNMVRIENAIIEAKAKHAQIIVFPESCILGWVNPTAFQRAQPIEGEDSRELAKLAKKYRIYLCIGLDEKMGDQLYDSAILIDEDGKIILKHRKINVLPELMDPPYSAGNEVSVVKTRFGNIGVLICADSFQQDLLDSMKNKKPDLLLIPYGWAAVEKDWPAHGEDLVKVVKNAAAKVNCAVVGTNLVGQISHGPWTGQIYGGLSAGYDLKRNILFTGKDRERDIVILTIKY